MKVVRIVQFYFHSFLKNQRKGNVNMFFLPLLYPINYMIFHAN